MRSNEKGLVCVEYIHRHSNVLPIADGIPPVKLTDASGWPCNVKVWIAVSNLLVFRWRHRYSVRVTLSLVLRGEGGLRDVIIQ